MYDFAVLDETGVTMKVADEQFSLARLSPCARQTIGLLVTRPDLLAQFATNPEAVWQECESLNGTLSIFDRQTLQMLYKIFSVSSDLWGNGDSGSSNPLECWDGPVKPQT